MAGSLDVDKRPIVNSGGIPYSSTNMNTNKGIGHEPPDVFCGLGSLIVEGRVPRTEVEKEGYGVHHEEGPHALKHFGPSGGINRSHVCYSHNYMCKKDENFRKHMLLLWQNNVPVSIEVLLCSDCRVSKQKANSVEYSTIPEPGSILLEQWTISISNNLTRKDPKFGNAGQTNVEQSAITARGLFQAVRSYLHFSQLSAWYDSFRGTTPSCILYRITIPGEAFASKFTCQPEQHYFPPAAVGSMAVVNVAVRSYPRTDKIPRVLCTHNSEELRLRSPTAFTTFSVGEIIPSDSSSSTSPVCSSNDIADQSSDSKATSPTIGQEENKLSVAGALSWKETERIETDLRKMALVKNKMTECTLSNLNASNTTLPRSDSMDSMLGDSLLDPPQDLQKMPPKRYQSPSRCGSPSIETPEHLLFRSHYNSIENTSSLSQGYKIKGIDTKYSESAKSRLARQDLLRRRDIGQTFGIAGSCHGLHPRMLLNVGHNQPRLSLPPKQASTITNPAIISSGPYRAFPPERGMHQFSYMDRSSCNQTYLTPNCDVEDIDSLSQNFENMQVKCNTSGKYKCDQLQHDCLDVNQATENTTCDKEVQHFDANEISKNKNKESLKEQTNPHSDISRPSEENTSSFALGAKKKSMISLSRTSTPKKNDHFLSFSSKRKHYKHFESEDDTGMEVAEYALDDVSGKNLTSLENEYKSTTEQFDERQTNFQKEITNILEGLEPKKKICTSRRSSLKDEDRLFPHKCNCSKDRTQSQYEHIQDETTRYPMFNNSSVTQVYRSDAQTPSLMPSPLLQFKSVKNDPANNVPRKPLDKAEILLGAIMRTCERNKHLEYKDDPATDSSISSKEDSYSVGAVRKSPEERKNSAGDADDEDEGNTSSDNGSSILSSPSSSDEEDFQHQRSTSSDMGWYKTRYKGVVSRAKKKNIASEKKSDSSSSQCSPCNLIPSTNSSSTSTFNENQSNIYVKTQSICDNEENAPGLKSASNLCLNKESMFVEDLDDKVLISSTKHASKNKAIEAAIDIQQDLSCNDEAAMNIKKLKEGSVNKNYITKGNNDNIESEFENEPASESVETTKLGLTKLRTRSENLHEFSNKAHHDIVFHDKTHQEELSNCYKLQQLEQVELFDENSKDTASIDKKPFCDNDSSDEKVFTESNIEPTKEELYKCATNINNGISIPTMVQKDNFRKTLNSATSMVFHRNTGLPLSSSPAPLRRGAYDFGYDSSINTPNAIKRALYPTSSSRGRCSNILGSKGETTIFEPNSSDKEDRSQDLDDAGTEIDNCESDETSNITRIPKKRHDTCTDESENVRKRHRSSKSSKLLSVSAPATVSSHGSTANNLLGTFEESVLNGRLEPVSTVEGFSAEIGASGSFHPKHKTVPVNVFFYNMCCDNSPSISSPYLGHINLGKKGYRVPQSGTIQATLFNPLGTVIKMFVVMYDLSDMPPNSQTFIRQRTFYMPTTGNTTENQMEKVDNNHDVVYPVGASPKWLRYLIHLRFASSKSGKIYLHTDIRMIIFRKSDLDTAADHNITPGKLGGFELRSFTNGPTNPKFSPRKINFRHEE